MGMFGTIARKVFGSANDRFIKKQMPTVQAINALEPELEKLTDAELAGQTLKLRNRVEAGESLDDILPEAFASVREAAKRALGLRHYDVQLIGGIVLHNGMITEMATGEGKTLVATLAAYLNAVAGKGVHVVTVNDYLAKRDAEWMGQVYDALGLTTGIIVHGLDDVERKAAYSADITYGTNNEFGFDYLRDNMKFSLDTMVQRPFNFAIVDEVDSILIDEARTPLIISGPAEDAAELYRAVNTIIPELVEGDYELDEKVRSINLTEDGVNRVEELLLAKEMMPADTTLYDSENITLLHHVNQALRAHKMFRRDTDYVVRGGKVVIVDEFTGRMMEGRRYSDGLHQALEAREEVHINPENQTLASITFQNYFRMYPKLSGMTGTAATEAAEFGDIYKLDVIQIPTNVPIQRDDRDDKVFRTEREKVAAIIEHVKECLERGQPVLLGTGSIERSELLAEELTKAKIKHNVLNAKQHESEAGIIAQAGRIGTVTIATNMAGRGTDIQLGGNVDMRVAEECEGLEGAQLEEAIARIKAEVAEEKQKVKDLGGLAVIGSERHESRRIDNQLRGRSGRQGDPGMSAFYVSLEDDLMRIFGSERMDSMLQKLGLEEGEAIEHPWINKALEKAQQKVEARNYDIRKNLLRFDDVMNDQRKVIYEQRIELMQAEQVADTLKDMRHETVDQIVSKSIPPNTFPEQWDTEQLDAEIKDIFNVEAPINEWAAEEGISDETVRERLYTMADQLMAAKVAQYSPDVFHSVEKSILLQILDTSWKEHLQTLDHLRQGIGLRAYAQRDPLNEYKTEAFTLFESMLAKLRETVTQALAHVQLEFTPPEELTHREVPEMHEEHIDPLTGENEVGEGEEGGDTWGKVGRNAPCPCGSGKKFKHCHGKLS